MIAILPHVMPSDPHPARDDRGRGSPTRWLDQHLSGRHRSGRRADEGYRFPDCSQVSHRQIDPLMLAILPFQFDDYRHGHPVEVQDRYLDPLFGVIINIAHALHRQIQRPVMIEPFPPEPAQVFPCLVVHRPEEIHRGRMAIGLIARIY